MPSKFPMPTVLDTGMTKFSDIVPIKSIVCSSDGGAGQAGKEIEVGGWVKTGRLQGKDSFLFLDLNDGSCAESLQVVVHKNMYMQLKDLKHVDTCVHLKGKLKPPYKTTKQKIELEAIEFLHVGTVDPTTYPLHKEDKHKEDISFEFLRDHLHLRARTSKSSAILRIRDELDFATSMFFREHGFRRIHAPVITTSDCEGAGEMFQVTSLFSQAKKLAEEVKQSPIDPADIEAAEVAVQEKAKAVSELKSVKASKEKIGDAVAKLTRAKESRAKLQKKVELKERCEKTAGLPLKDGKIDHSEDFFARQAFLTVSGQLQAETLACVLGRVYTFGPAFRAEHSHTSRHLAEFWMVEPEIAFADLQVAMKCAESYVKYLCQWLLEHCLNDMELMPDKTAIDRLKMVASTDFERLPYTKAINILVKASKEGKEFDNKVEWGIDLASEHERYLTDEVFKKPVIVYDYPKDIKAFYMKVNEDGKTAAAFDMLVPKVGELVGGSQREDGYEKLKERMEELKMPMKPYEWYLDLRRFGSAPHSGFGLGIERMVLFATGLDNIRDVIPFPRYPRRADL